MKTLWLVVVCAVVSTVGLLSPSLAVNIQGYAKIYNYTGYWDHYGGDPQYPSSGTQQGFHSWATWTDSSSEALSVSVRNTNTLLPVSEDPSQNCLYFDLSGSAVVGDYASTPTDFRLGGQGYYRVQFDWRTTFTSGGDCLKLDIWYDGIPGSIWSVTPGPGSHAGHVDIAMPDVEDVFFRVSVVPEPGGIADLGLLVGAGSFIRRRRS